MTFLPHMRSCIQAKRGLVRNLMITLGFYW